MLSSDLILCINQMLHMLSRLILQACQCSCYLSVSLARCLGVHYVSIGKCFETFFGLVGDVWAGVWAPAVNVIP